MKYSNVNHFTRKFWLKLILVLLKCLNNLYTQISFCLHSFRHDLNLEERIKIMLKGTKQILKFFSGETFEALKIEILLKNCEYIVKYIIEYCKSNLIWIPKMMFEHHFLHVLPFFFSSHWGMIVTQDCVNLRIKIQTISWVTERISPYRLVIIKLI